VSYTEEYVAGGVLGEEEKRNAHLVLASKGAEKRPLRRSVIAWQDNSKMDITEM
jgi:hypothetical protein